MNAISENGRLLDIAKNTSNDIINTFPKQLNSIYLQMILK